MPLPLRKAMHAEYRRLLSSVYRLGMLLAAVALAGSSPGWAGVPAAELQQRSAEVEKMTVIERDRLQRNWTSFQNLPPDRKHHFRQLHLSLAEDLKSGGNRLNDTMQTYSQWLQTLTPGQREDLRQARSSAQKLDLVRKFKDEQERQAQSRVLEEPAIDPGRMRRSFMSGKPLSTTELEAAMSALLELLPRAERDGIQELDAQEKWSRYRRILQASTRQAGGPRDWPDQQQQDAVLAAVKITEQAEQLKSIKQDRPRRVKFIHVMLSSLTAEMLAQSAPFEPRKGDLEALYAAMDNATRDELLQLPQQEMQQELLRRYYQQNRSQDPAFRELVKSHREFQSFVGQLLREAEIGGRFGGLPRPGGPGPDRPPFGPPDGEPGRGPRDKNRPRPPREGDGPPPG